MAQASNAVKQAEVLEFSILLPTSAAGHRGRVRDTSNDAIYLENIKIGQIRSKEGEIRALTVPDENGRYTLVPTFATKVGKNGANTAIRNLKAAYTASATSPEKKEAMLKAMGLRFPLFSVVSLRGTSILFSVNGKTSQTPEHADGWVVGIQRKAVADVSK